MAQSKESPQKAEMTTSKVCQKVIWQVLAKMVGLGLAAILFFLFCLRMLTTAFYGDKKEMFTGGYAENGLLRLAVLITFFFVFILALGVGHYEDGEE